MHIHACVMMKTGACGITSAYFNCDCNVVLNNVVQLVPFSIYCMMTTYLATNFVWDILVPRRTSPY